MAPFGRPVRSHSRRVPDPRPPSAYSGDGRSSGRGAPVAHAGRRVFPVRRRGRRSGRILRESLWGSIPGGQPHRCKQCIGGSPRTLRGSPEIGPVRTLRSGSTEGLRGAEETSRRDGLPAGKSCDRAGSEGVRSPPAHGIGSRWRGAREPQPIGRRRILRDARGRIGPTPDVETVAGRVLRLLSLELERLEAQNGPKDLERLHKIGQTLATVDDSSRRARKARRAEPPRAARARRELSEGSPHGPKAGARTSAHTRRSVGPGLLTEGRSSPDLRLAQIPWIGTKALRQSQI
jgi:hypothetical protein